MPLGELVLVLLSLAAHCPLAPGPGGEQGALAVVTVACCPRENGQLYFPSLYIIPASRYSVQNKITMYMCVCNVWWLLMGGSW